MFSATQPNFAEINLLPTKNGFDCGTTFVNKVLDILPLMIILAATFGCFVLICVLLLRAGGYESAIPRGRRHKKEALFAGDSLRMLLDWPPV